MCIQHKKVQIAKNKVVIPPLTTLLETALVISSLPALLEAEVFGKTYSTKYVLEK